MTESRDTSGFWGRLAEHPQLVKGVSGALAVVLLLGGLVAGIHQASDSRGSATGELSPDTQQLVAKIPASRHSLVGVVRAVGPRGFIVRNQRGVFFAVRWGPASQFRAAGRTVRPGALRAGDHVLILGRPAEDGSLQASVVTITARSGVGAPNPQRPAQGNPAPAGGPPPSSQ